MGVREMKDLKISEELIKNVLVKETENLSEEFSFYIDEDYIVFRDEGETLFDYNIYKFVHLNLKQWANFKNVFNIIDWSGEPEEIIAKAEEIMNEIN